MYVPHPLYHSSVDGQCFHVLAIVNSASVNTRVHVSFQSRVFPDICPELGLLDHMVALFLVFSGTSILFSIVAVSVYIATNSTIRSTFLQHLLFVDFLVMAILTVVR